MTEEKEYMTIEEAAQYAGIKRASVYNYMKDLKITPKKFGRVRRKYISLADVKRMKEYREKPWMLLEPEQNVA